MRDSGKFETVLVVAGHDDRQQMPATLDERGVMDVILDWGVDVAAEFCSAGYCLPERR